MGGGENRGTRPKGEEGMQGEEITGWRKTPQRVKRALLRQLWERRRSRRRGQGKAREGVGQREAGAAGQRSGGGAGAAVPEGRARLADRKEKKQTRYSTPHWPLDFQGAERSGEANHRERKEAPETNSRRYWLIRESGARKMRDRSQGRARLWTLIGRRPSATERRAGR